METQPCDIASKRQPPPSRAALCAAPHASRRVEVYGRCVVNLPPRPVAQARRVLRPQQAPPTNLYLPFWCFRPPAGWPLPIASCGITTATRTARTRMQRGRQRSGCRRARSRTATPIYLNSTSASTSSAARGPTTFRRTPACACTIACRLAFLPSVVRLVRHYVYAVTAHHRRGARSAQARHAVASRGAKMRRFPPIGEINEQLRAAPSLTLMVDGCRGVCVRGPQQRRTNPYS